MGERGQFSVTCSDSRIDRKRIEVAQNPAQSCKSMGATLIIGRRQDTELKFPNRNNTDCDVAFNPDRPLRNEHAGVEN